jgi:hypothetical protein
VCALAADFTLILLLITLQENTKASQNGQFHNRTAPGHDGPEAQHS